MAVEKGSLPVVEEPLLLVLLPHTYARIDEGNPRQIVVDILKARVRDAMNSIYNASGWREWDHTR